MYMGLDFMWILIVATIIVLEIAVVCACRIHLDVSKVFLTLGRVLSQRGFES